MSDDHAELLRRRALTEDAARPDAVERGTPRTGARRGRTSPTSSTRARSSSTDASRSPRQRIRRDLADLIARTPADGLVAGTARINGDLFGDDTQRLRRAVLRLHGARRHPGRARPPQEGSPLRTHRAHAAADRVLRRGRRRTTGRHRLSRRLRARRARVQAVGRAVGSGAAHRDRQGPLLRGQRRDRGLLRI